MGKPGIYKESTIILGLDPGTRQTGWAVLTATAGGSPRLLAHGTIISRSALVGLDRQLWILSHLQDLITEHQPQVLAYEGFTWRADDNYVVGRSGLELLRRDLRRWHARRSGYVFELRCLPSLWRGWGRGSHGQ